MEFAMSPRVVALFESTSNVQRTPEWYAMRRTMLTASECAGALGIKPYPSYRGCPRSDFITKKVENKKFNNIFCAHGVKYEDEARDALEDIIGEKIYEFGLVQHPKYKWLGASPDGVTHLGRLIEIKCPLKREIVPGKVPELYYPQLQIQMECCDMDQLLFVQYRPPPNRMLDIVSVERDPSWFEKHRETLYETFLEYRAALEVYVPPPIPTCRIQDEMYT